MSTNSLQPIIITKSDLLFYPPKLDMLVEEILRFKKENFRYPKRIIFNEEMAQRYLDHYTQGKSYNVSFDKKGIEFVVNIRLRAAELIMI